MTDPLSKYSGADFYQTGKEYDLSQDSSPAAATLARAAFLQGANVGHTESIRALAHMTYYGSGGEKNAPKAFQLLWVAFLAKDREALPELVDMLEDFSDSSVNPSIKSEFQNAASDAQEILKRMDRLNQFLRSLKAPE